MKKGSHLSLESRQKLSAALKGKKKSEEHIKHMSESHKGKKFSEEQKANISKANKGKKKHTVESKRKISEGNKGKTFRHSEEHKQLMHKKMLGRKITWAQKIGDANRGIEKPTLKGIPRSQEVKDKISETKINTSNGIKQNISNKRHQTLKAHKTFNTSKDEENLYKQLCEEYGENDIIRQYDKDPRYPFSCDFYIKSKDLFIELNKHWSHGKHPFDPNNKEDQEKLSKWRKKEDSKYYKNAIIVWTIRDPLKQKTAKENNLNYQTIY